jgi:hypothetical protein
MSTRRDPIEQYRRARARRGRLAPAPTGDIRSMPAWLVAAGEGDGLLPETRTLERHADVRADLETALRVLQRHNRAIERRFGLHWSDVAPVVIDEARRRALPSAAAARLLTGALERDARERHN